MKITVFGATGGTGKHIIGQALEAGHEVKAFVRDTAKMGDNRENLEVVNGDILDSASVDKAIAGVDAVLLALGSREAVLAKGTENIINSMKKHGARRVIVESSYSMSGSPEGTARLKAQGMTEEQLTGFQHILDDKTAQEKETRESGLDFVIVWPLALTDGEKTGKYREGEKLDLKLEDHISRADVADFMLKQLADDKWLGKTVVISY